MLNKRKVTLIDYKDLDPEFLRPEQILVKLDDSIRVSPVDLGSWAYLVRETDSPNPCGIATLYRKFDGFGVDETSIQKERIEFIRNFLDEILIGSWRQITFQGNYQRMNYCLNWCDSNGFSAIFSSQKNSRKAYFSYTNFLDSEIKLGRLLPRTASDRQRDFKRLIKIQWPKSWDNILSGIPSIFYIRQDRDLPYKKDIIQFINVSLALSTQMSSAIIEGKPFPWLLSFGAFDGAIFPVHHGALTPFNQNISKLQHPTELRYRTRNEFLEAYPKSDKRSRWFRSANFDKSQIALEKNNSDVRSYFRMLNANHSIIAYLVLLQLYTGAPSSELLNIEYIDGDYSLENDDIKRELSSVKFRAGGKVVRYPLGDKGLSILKQYLKLRSWILDGQSHDFLFFKLSKKSEPSISWTIKRLTGTFSWRYTNRIRGLYVRDDAPNIAKLGRQYKSLMLHLLDTKPHVIASLLNHSEKTNSSVYSNVSPDVHHNELAAYWDSVRATASIVSDKRNGAKSVAGGHCDSFNKPQAVIKAPPMEPDCKVQQGCLYCEHYIVHADETDVHKLMSLKYVASEIRTSSADMEHSEQLFRDLLIRIEVILDEVKSRSSRHMTMVIRIERKVFELGELTPFWERRMARYEKMGVIV